MRPPRPSRRRYASSALVAAVLAALAVVALPAAAARSGTPPLERVHDTVVHGAPRSGTASAKLGITYGPYLGRRCRHVHRGCGLVGIDVVFGRAATRVEATAGAQTIRLRTPGKHDGVRYRDWVGTFTRTGFARTPRPHRDVVYAAVELRVRFADGRRARAVFPHVLVAPGWG